MSIAKVPASQISDWESFHEIFAKVLGFPHWYGRNMDAWIDCLTSADSLSDGLIRDSLIAADDEVLTLQIDDVRSFRERCPDQYLAVIEGSAFVNWRRIEAGERPIVALSFYK